MIVLARTSPPEGRNRQVGLSQFLVPLNLPGISCTVAEQIEALRDVAGNDVVRLIKPQPDPVIEKIVEGWPRDFAPERALALGFKADASFKDIIQIYLDDDLQRPPS